MALYLTHTAVNAYVCIHNYHNFQDKNGTPIICAVCKEGHDRLLEKLLDRGADPNARDQAKNNKPALVLAVEGNHIECVKLLMVSNVEKNAVYDAVGVGAVHRYDIIVMHLRHVYDADAR